MNEVLHFLEIAFAVSALVGVLALALLGLVTWVTWSALKGLVAAMLGQGTHPR
jgi:hypothetical protein